MAIRTAAIRTLCLLYSVIAVPSLFAQEPRYALVIGNKDYPQEIGSLVNTINDATDMAGELRSTGFQVQLVLNANYDETRRAVKDFYEKLNQAPRNQVVGLFYYAGHGIQYEGENYIIPVDAKIQYEDDILRTCFPIQRMVLNNMELADTRMNILILDACRNNPFPRKFRSVSQGGLAEMKTGFGSFVAYATAPGSIASDGAGRNGLYTQELLKAMRIPGLLIEQVFKEVRRNVLHLSGERQYTWDSSNIVGDFYFIPGGHGAEAMPLPTTTQPAASTSTPTMQGSPAKTEAKRSSANRVVDEDMLGMQLTRLTDGSISFPKRQSERDRILAYFVVPYAKVNVMLGGRIDERLAASKWLDRLVTLPPTEFIVRAMETSDSGRIVELLVETKE